MTNLKKIALASVLALSSISANSAVITYGDLSTDADYNVIADTELGREYLRFDTFNMSYAETVAATSAGGIYEDWSIADSIISDNFINALFSQSGENTCPTETSTSGTSCGTLSGWNDGSFGESWQSSLDYYAFESLSTPIGLVQINSAGMVQNYHTWSSVASLDNNSNIGSTTINLLLYRENTLHIGGFNSNAAANNLVSNVTSVPLPATLGLLGLAMTGLSFRRKSY